MTSTCFHTFPHTIDPNSLPRQFNCPFHYTPHPLCIEASDMVQNYLKSRSDWREELAKGKMFGVLVVETAEQEIGFLAAYSGILMGSNKHAYFVPPVYDLLNPDGFFKAEETCISALNTHITGLETSEQLHQLKEAWEQSIRTKDAVLAQAKNNLKMAKKARDLKRQSSAISPETAEELIRESQRQKADYKRLEHELQQQVDTEQQALDKFQSAIETLKQERKQRSAALQQKLFEQFILLNARGEQKDLCEIFAATSQLVPPAGAGECAAPKLLQYAFLHQMHPICMAEFWWGESPKKSIRHHGSFYPSCKSKCEPILHHMLVGLDVEENPLKHPSQPSDLPVLYEDDYLVIVNKPEGMLSVPGKEAVPSVWDYARKRYPQADGPLIVHRLDMATSGILVLAKTKEVHQMLQAQFAQRTVKKRYTAILDGEISTQSGVIRLPLAPDYEDRPRQLVDYEHGKTAVTRYQVEKTDRHTTHIFFWPLTGRTHQLRVHAAHPAGLNCPILGDNLYGHPDKRLFLHADSLEFKHPITNKMLRIHCPAPF